MKRDVLLLIALAVFIVALPHHLRLASGNNVFAGDESYFHASIAEQISDNIENVQPFHLVLSLASRLGKFGTWFTPALFALLSVFLFALLMSRLKFDSASVMWMVLVYILSPILVTTSVIISPHSFMICLLLAGTYLLLTKWPLGAVSFLLFSLAGTRFAIMTLMIVWILFLWRKIPKKVAIVTSVVNAVVLLRSKVPLFFEVERSLTNVFSDFGSTHGLSIFAALLSIVGLVLVWRHKGRRYGIFALLFVFVCTSFFFQSLLVYVNIIVSCLAGIALGKLSSRKWELSFLRNVSLLVLFCGLLFSTIVHAIEISNSPPTPDFFATLPDKKGVILSHESYGLWINYAGHQSLTTQRDGGVIQNDANRLFYGLDVEDALSLLSKYNVSYILITPEMREGLVWERPDQGLDFLLSHKTFKKANSTTVGEVWEIDYEET